MREQRVLLENRVHRSLIWREIFDLLPKKQYLASGHFFKARNHAKQSRFPAAGGAKEREKLIVLNAQRRALKRGKGASGPFNSLFQPP